MGRHYTQEERDAALRAVDTHGSLSAASRATGIAAPTLKRWRDARDRQQATSTQAQIDAARAQLATDTLKLARAIEGAINGAPLNQLSTALGTVVDRLLKLEEYAAGYAQAGKEQVIRVEYKYPDNSIHDAPPWAGGDPGVEGSVPGGGVRTPVRQDGGRQADHHGAGAKGQDDLVAESDVSNGKHRLARPEVYPRAGSGGD